jgi:endonuclease/exonuclease/phosphatase family metal-dependent hydrolase
VKILHLIAIIGNSLLGLLTVIVLLSVYVPPSFSLYLPLFGLLFPFLIVFHLLFLVYWIWHWKKYALISLVCLLVSWPSLTHFIQWNSTYFEQSEEDWVVLTYNIHHAREIQEEKAGGDWRESIQKWNQFLKTYPKLDIVCLQENAKNNTYPLPGLDGLKYSHHCKSRGPSILSRRPFVHTGCIDFGNSVNGAIYADVQGEGLTFRIYNVHLQSNQVSDITQPFLKEDEMAKGENVQKIKQVFRLYLRTAEQRAEQLKVLLAHAEESPHPVIIAGDFNEGPHSFVYRKLRGRYTDTFKEKGRGVSSTYAGNLPFLRIDHIFHDEDWKTKHHQVCRLPFSDHYPVAVSLSYQGPKSSR